MCWRGRRWRRRVYYCWRKNYDDWRRGGDWMMYDVLMMNCAGNLMMSMMMIHGRNWSMRRCDQIHSDCSSSLV